MGREQCLPAEALVQVGTLDQKIMPQSMPDIYAVSFWECKRSKRLCSTLHAIKGKAQKPSKQSSRVTVVF